MPKIEYTKHRFSRSTTATIEQANEIIEEFAKDGYDLTLRQLYYQFVSRGLIDNNLKAYKRLGDAINKGRLGGLIDWMSITDRGRNLLRNAHWDSPKDIIDATAQGYAIDKWKTQNFRPEVWIEKEALLGVIDRVCVELDVPYYACRGYNSQSEQWRASMRFKRYAEGGQIPVILHLGDHDPSGLDMTRDIVERMNVFMGGMKVRRLALNRMHIKKYNPPPNPAKQSDSRYYKYVKHTNTQKCWELDALSPKVIAGLIRRAVESMIDAKAWNKAIRKEKRDRARLKKVSKNWKKIQKYMRRLK